MAKKKKPKVTLKRGQVIVLATSIVAVCACMLTVAVLTSPRSVAPNSPSSASQGSLSAALPLSQDVGVAQVVAQLEAAERRALESERRRTVAAQSASRKGAVADRLVGEGAGGEKGGTENSSAGSKASTTIHLAAGSKDSSFGNILPDQPSTGESVPVGKDYTFPAARPGATLVFVLDDGGQNLSDLQHYLNLPFPVAVAVLPQLAYSVESARRVRASGRHELLLHQPMQAVNLSVNPGPGAITPEMTTTEIDAIVRKNLLEIGPVAGMNNHEGSLITESKVKIGKVIEICQKQGIFFLDSRTTAATAAPQAALELGAQIWERDVFLDNTQNRADILEQIQRGLAVANKKGYAIMIGHVWSGGNLAQIMEELYPVLKAQGYSFSTVGGLYENFGG